MTTLPKPYPEAQKTGRSSLSSGGNLASLSIGRERGEGVLTSFATGGACTAGVERVSLEDQTAEEEAEEEEEAQSKSTTSARPRTATTASATRCFGGRAFAAGLAMGGRLG